MSFRKFFKGKKEELVYDTEYKGIKKFIDKEDVNAGFNYLTKMQERMTEITDHDKLIIDLLTCILQNKANKIPENLELIPKLENNIKDPMMFIDFTIAKADTFWKAGKQQEALSALESVQSKVTKLNEEFSNQAGKTDLEIVEREADVENIKGIVCWLLGDVIKSQKAFQKALSLRGILGNKKNFASSLNNLGNVFTYKGELQFALDHHTQALEIRKTLPNKSELASSLGNLAEIYHYMGNYDSALDYYQQAQQIFETIDNKLFQAKLYYQLVSLHLEYNNLSKAEEYLQKLSDLHKAASENPYIKTLFILSEGMILKDSDRLMKKFKAGENFLQIANGPVVDSELTVQAIFNLNDILLLEMRLSQNEEILNEVQSWSSKVIQLAEEQKSSVLIVQSYLLDSKLKLLDFKVDEAKELLIKGQETANKKGIMKFEYFISRELDQLLSQEEKWEELKANGASLIERIDLTGLEQTLNNLIRKREEFAEIEHEEPVLFLILLEGGLSAFSSKFKSDITLDDQLIAGFMSAVTTFGQQVFSTMGSVERIKQGEFTIISKKVGESLTFCYAFKGPSYLAIKKLDKLLVDFETSEISQTMLKKLENNELLEGEEEQALNKFINDIIVQSKEKDLITVTNANQVN
jgi:tetratricopeptide (TPR) repeat protein